MCSGPCKEHCPFIQRPAPHDAVRDNHSGCEQFENCFIIPSGSDPEEKNPEDQSKEKVPSARREATPTEQAMGEGPMTGDQRGILKGHGERLGMSQVAKAATCQEVTGKNPSQLTVNDANKLIEHMAGLS